jgi:hypothetical protein
MRSGIAWPIIEKNARFARPGIHVERVEGIPYGLGQIGAGQPFDSDAGGERFFALAADDLALARIERGEEILERRVAVVLPMELLVGALQIAARAQRLPFGLRQKRHVRGREFALPGDFGERIAECEPHLLGERAGAGEEARAGHGRERHRGLQLRIVVAADALERVRPAVIEDVFALRVAFQIAGRGADEFALSGFDEQMARLPAGAAANRLRLFKRGEECVRNEWVGRLSSCGRLWG